MIFDKDIHEGLTTERAKRAYKRLCVQSENVLEKLVKNVMRRKGVGWNEEFAMRVQLERHKLEVHQNAVTTAMQIEFLEVQMQATVSTFAASLQEKL